jgi:aminoglycoside 6'-N-acetyltransferase I
MILVSAFREHWPNGWPTQAEALREVYEMLDIERVCRTAWLEGKVVGWIGGIPQYDGLVWELHPLAVDPRYQRQGIGTALVRHFEERVRVRGGMTITLGTDDEDDMTSLAGADLYDNLWEQVRNIRDLKGHPYVFYQRMGFTITGVVPDANGPGKPDILMAKRVSHPIGNSSMTGSVMMDEEQDR